MRNEEWWWRLRRKYIWAMPEGLSASRFPVLNFPNIVRLTANDKDFSLALEMTIRGYHSHNFPNFPIPSYQSLLTILFQKCLEELNRHAKMLDRHAFIDLMRFAPLLRL